MFDVGFQEIMLIFVILLIVVGPERLPKLARTLGLWIGKARTIVSSVKSEVEREIRVSELKQSLQEQAPTEEFKKLASQVKSINSDLKSTSNEVKSSIQSTIENNKLKPGTPVSTTSSSSTDTTSSTSDGLSSSTSSSPTSQPVTDPAAKISHGEETSNNDKVSAEKF